MALVHADRVKETSTTTGTGTYDLAGAVTGFRTFVAGIATGNTCYYVATDGVDWEVGIGTVTDASPDTLARTTILKSSNAHAAVNWAAGTRTIFCGIPADKFTSIIDLLTTRGDLIRRGASVPERLGIGSALQLVGNDGTDVAWVNGGLRLLTSGTVSAASSLDIVLTGYTAYRGLKIVLANFIPATDGDYLALRLSSNGGSSYDASAGNYRHSGLQVFDNTATSGGLAGAWGNTSDTEIQLMGDDHSVGNGAAEGCSVVIELLDQTNTAAKQKVLWSCTMYRTNDISGLTSGQGIRTTAQDTDALRILFLSGNITSGKYAVYGYV